MRDRIIETGVGLFVLISILSMLFLALRVSGLSCMVRGHSYTVSADFDNIGNLKVRSPVTLAGVRIGQVSNIKLDSSRFKAVVSMQLDANQSTLPVDTSASIRTQGLLGANYIGLKPGFDQNFLKNGSVIKDTYSALVLEDLVGQLLFGLKNSRVK